MFLCSSIIYSYFYNYLLLTLLTIELIMLSLLLLLFLNMIVLNILLILYYLVFVVCEGVLGLSLLILLIRRFGNNNIYMISLLLW